MSKPKVLAPGALDERILSRRRSSIDTHINRIRAANPYVNNQDSIGNFKGNSKRNSLIPQRKEESMKMKVADSRLLQRRNSSLENHINRIRSVNTNINDQDSAGNFKRNSKRSYFFPQKREERVEMRDHVDPRLLQRRDSSLANHINRIRSMYPYITDQGSTENFKRKSIRSSLIPQKIEEGVEMKDDIDSRILKPKDSSEENRVDLNYSVSTNIRDQDLTGMFKRNSKVSSFIPQKREQSVEMEDGVDSRILKRKDSSEENRVDLNDSVSTNINDQDSTGTFKRNSKVSSFIPQKREESVEIENGVDSRILKPNDSSEENRVDLNHSVSTNISDQASTGTFKRNSKVSSFIPQKREESVEMEDGVDSRILKRKDNSEENRVDLNDSVSTNINGQDSTGTFKRNSKVSSFIPQKREESVEMEVSVDSRTLKQKDSSEENRVDLNDSASTNINDQDSTGCLKRNSNHDSHEEEEKMEREANVDKNINNFLNSPKYLKTNSENSNLTKGTEEGMKTKDVAESSMLDRTGNPMDAQMDGANSESANKNLNNEKSSGNLNKTQAKKTTSVTETDNISVKDGKSPKLQEPTHKSNSDKYLEPNPNIQHMTFVEEQIQKFVDSKVELIGEEFSK